MNPFDEYVRPKSKVTEEEFEEFARVFEQFADSLRRVALVDAKVSRGAKEKEGVSTNEESLKMVVHARNRPNDFYTFSLHARSGYESVCVGPIRCSKYLRNSKDLEDFFKESARSFEFANALGAMRREALVEWKRAEIGCRSVKISGKDHDALAESNGEEVTITARCGRLSSHDEYFLKSVSFESSGIFGKIVSLDEKKDGVDTLLTLKVVRVNQRIWE